MAQHHTQHHTQEHTSPSASCASAGRAVQVWDLPTRIFHWSFAAFTILAFVSSEGALWLHVYSGTMLLGFIAWRAVWGVIGSRYAQFGDFVHGPDTVKSYARQLFQFRPPYHAGHNPLGGWMVMALLVVVMLASLTGMMTREDGYVGPLSHVAGGLFGHAHEGLGSFVMVLVGVHVLGVLAHGVISRENLVRAMISGDKTPPAGAAAQAIRPVGIVRPLIALALAMGVVLYFVR